MLKIIPNIMILGIVAVLYISINSCKKEKALPVNITDEDIYRLIQTSTKHYYQSGNVLSGAGNSPHGYFKLWTNTKALDDLDADQELPENAVFSDSSFIVKEITNATGDLQLYAIMYKLKSTWFWGEYSPTGEVVYGIGNVGGSCVSCHGQSGNRDLTNTYTLH